MSFEGNLARQQYNTNKSFLTLVPNPGEAVKDTILQFPTDRINPAFSTEHELSRIDEMKAIGRTREEILPTVKSNLSAYLYERQGALSPFSLTAEPAKVSQSGYEHRGDGDLSASYSKSVEEAGADVIKRRYEVENAGWEMAKRKFFQLPVGSTVFLSSCTPDKSIPGYAGHNNAYLYHILPHESGDQDKRTIKAITWVNYFTKEEQINVLKSIDPFAHVEESEESILLSPVAAYPFGDSIASFRLIWEKLREEYQKKKREPGFRMPSSDFVEGLLMHGKEVWERKYPTLAAMSNNSSSRLVDGRIDDQFKLDWDIMLNHADELFNGQSASGPTLKIHEDVSHKIPSKEIVQINLKRDYAGSPSKKTDNMFIFNQFRHLSYQPKPKATACGLSSGMGFYGITNSATVTTGTFIVQATPGFSSGNINMAINAMPASATSTLNGERTLKCEKCPICDAKDIVAKISGGKIICPVNGCTADYAC